MKNILICAMQRVMVMVEGRGCHGHGALCIMGGAGVCCQQPGMMGKFCDGAGQRRGGGS